MTEKLFSIIVPIYNQERQLDAAIESLRHQGAVEFEVFLEDDGSTDRTVETAERLIAGDPRFQLEQLEHVGTAARSRNRGLVRARGKYIVFLDGDDRLEPGALPLIAAELARHGEPDLLALALEEELAMPDGSFRPGAHHVNALPTGEILSGREALDRFARNAGMLFKGYSPLAVYRREFLLAHQLFQREDILMFEDAEWAARVYFFAERVAALDYAYYHYRRSAGSATGSYTPRTLSDAATAIRSLIGFVHDPETKQDRRTQRFFAKHILSLLFMIFFHPSSVAKSVPANRRSAFLSCLGNGDDFRRYTEIARHASRPRRLATPFLWVGRFPGMMFVPSLFFRFLYYPLCGRKKN